MERDKGLSTNSTAAKSRLIPSPYKKGNPISQNCEKDMKILRQNIGSFNSVINSTKQRKTDKFKQIEILLKEEKPDIEILTETRHYKDETKRTDKVINKPYFV